MAYGRKWKPSKSKAMEFKREMEKIEQFCYENNISTSLSMDSYYFNIDGVEYRVSNHTMKKSNSGAFNDVGEQTREFYHSKEDMENTVCITASKTRIIEIYNNLKNGKKLNKRGMVIA